MKLEERINQMIESKALVHDKSQLEAAKYLQKIAIDLLKRVNAKGECQSDNSNNKFNFFRRKTNKTGEKNLSEGKAIRGLYLWGEVGRGKTWLMDMFYSELSASHAALPIKTTLKVHRIHFHEFMLDIHKQLQNLPTQANPLTIIAKNMSQQFQLICLDEFHVLDIADAVILHELLKGLFNNNVVIITTSNRHPDDLYKGGTHRERFLPAIELIKHYCHVFNLNSETDYRRRKDEKQNVFFMSHDSETDVKLAKLFEKYSKTKNFSMNAIKIFGREVSVVRYSDNCIWFTFDVLCRGPRSSGDYLDIAKKYKTVILSDIPILNEGEEGPARRFLNLIDAFYDLHVHLILSSSVMIENMYQGDLLQFEFKRALSRLHEMRNQSWWQDK